MQCQKGNGNVTTKQLKTWQWMKLQSDIGHFLTICGTCLNKNRYVLPNCPNEQKQCARLHEYARIIATHMKA